MTLSPTYMPLKLCFSYLNPVSSIVLSLTHDDINNNLFLYETLLSSVYSSHVTFRGPAETTEITEDGQSSSN